MKSNICYLSRITSSILIWCLVILFSPFAALAETDTEQKSTSGFSWGAELGVGIDMGGDDMSTIDLDAYFGYHNSWCKLAGIGGGINMMMSNSCRSFPVYGILRTSFTSRPTLCFMDLRVGVGFNEVPGWKTKATFYCRPGIGFNLAAGKSFQSYLILSYAYNDMTFPGDKKDTLVTGLNLATISLGVTF